MALRKILILRRPRVLRDGRFAIAIQQHQRFAHGLFRRNDTEIAQPVYTI